MWNDRCYICALYVITMNVIRQKSNMSIQATMEWATYLGKRLLEASWQGIEAMKEIVPAKTAVKLLEAVCALLRHEPTVIDVSSPACRSCLIRVCLVQLVSDFCKVLETCMKQKYCIRDTASMCR